MAEYRSLGFAGSLALAKFGSPAGTSVPPDVDYPTTASVPLPTKVKAGAATPRLMRSRCGSGDWRVHGLPLVPVISLRARRSA